MADPVLLDNLLLSKYIVDAKVIFGLPEAQADFDYEVPTPESFDVLRNTPCLVIPYLLEHHPELRRFDDGKTLVTVVELTEVDTDLLGEPKGYSILIDKQGKPYNGLTQGAIVRVGSSYFSAILTKNVPFTSDFNTIRGTMDAQYREEQRRRDALRA